MILLRRHLGFLAVLLLLFGSAPAFAGKGDRASGPSFGDMTSSIALFLDSPGRLELPLERIRPALKAHYVDNGGTIYWVGSGRMTPFIQRLVDAEDDGLNPDDYPIDTLIDLRDGIDANDPMSAARAELYFSAFFVAYAADLKTGRVIPQKVDPRLFRNRKTVDVLRILTDMSKNREPTRYLDVFEPKNPQYQALKKLLVQYRERVAQGGWGTVDPGVSLKPGMRDARVGSVRKLLAATGDYEWQASGEPDLYDEQLAIAVKRFQSRHGLEAKGLIGKQTIIAMNVPVEERVRQIMLNMERWRWMPEDLGEYHFLVNIASFELQRIKSNTIIDRMNTVVGAPATQTPEFSDELEYIEFNPTWTVPYSIATKEMLPRLRANPYAYAGDFEVFIGGKLASWGSIDWYSYGPGNFPFTFRQKPGPKNALGKVKFMMPNKHNIYLHDTPSKDKFLQTARAFSHGCIRLSRPVDLAYALVPDLKDWSKERMNTTWAGGKTTRAMIVDHIPVHLIYGTAFKGDAGMIEFRPDVYGRDRKLYNALFGRPTS
ncbi:L,D-transpeptidase family protein [Aestuariivirga sp. YIM B02566]|uniref:L,D-transpeptidase family protein n=1 Tax=Taklimakanibacter albus TaxID=2800327 RepID=A0ACC5R9K4_9HYPH|nr:L,D-transpeptidase family protein [Aestuariivirga sp. YIM B02566]MBK1869359.1 L,D-transpeptidase family protein [Aestuariivirga sp. YIM B02566]